MVHIRCRSRGWAGRVLGAALLLVLAGVPALAAPAIERELVEAEIEKTDLVIQRASEMLQDAAVVGAQSHLASAVQIQKQAKTEFARGRQVARPERFYERAIELTQKARQEALQSMDLSRIGQQAQEAVRRLIDQAEDRAQEVGQLVADAGDAQARQVVEQGLDHLDRARRAQRDRDLVQAARLATLAATLLDRAAAMVRSDAAAATGADLLLERVQAFVAELEAALAEQGRRPSEVPQVVEIRGLLARALELARSGDSEQARRLAGTARQKTLELMADLRQDPGHAGLIDALDELEGLYTDLGPEIEASGDEQARKLLREGRRTLRRARDLLGHDRGRDALQHMLAAERLLKRAAQAAGI